MPDKKNVPKNVHSPNPPPVPPPPPPPPPPSAFNKKETQKKTKKKAVSFGTEPNVTVKHFTKDPAHKSDEVKPSSGEPTVLIPKVKSLRNLGLRSLLGRSQVERTALQIQSETEGKERNRIKSDQDKLPKTTAKEIDEIKLPKNYGAFTYRRKAKDEPKQLLIVDKKKGVGGQRDNSEVVLINKYANLQRVVRSDEDAQDAFDTLVQINDLGGLENVFNNDMQRSFRKFMMSWKISVMKPHTKMKIRNTVIPWSVCSRATDELTSCQIWKRRMTPRCCTKKPLTSDYSRPESLRDFKDKLDELTSTPSMSPLDQRAKRLRDELFDPEAPAWIYEREFGTLMKGAMRRHFHVDDDDAAFYGSKVPEKASHVFNPSRFEERLGEGMLPTRRAESYFLHMEISKASRVTSNVTTATTTAKEKPAKPELSSSKNKSNKAIKTVQASSKLKMWKSSIKKKKKAADEDDKDKDQDKDHRSSAV